MVIDIVEGAQKWAKFMKVKKHRENEGAQKWPKCNMG